MLLALAVVAHALHRESSGADTHGGLAVFWVLFGATVLFLCAATVGCWHQRQRIVTARYDADGKLLERRVVDVDSAAKPRGGVVAAAAAAELDFTLRRRGNAVA